jgi:membrane protein required for colicin V production
MNWVDVVLLAVVVFSALLGFVRGLVREVLGLGAWAGAAAAAVYGYSTAQPIVRDWITNQDVADAAAFGVLFLIVLIALSLIARGIGVMVRASVLGGVDRSLGLVFGVLRGAALIVAAYIVGGMVLPIDRWPPQVLEARALPVAYDGAAWVRVRLPQQYRPQVYPPPDGTVPSSQALLHATPQGHIFGAPHDEPSH